MEDVLPIGEARLLTVEKVVDSVTLLYFNESTVVIGCAGDALKGNNGLEFQKQ